MRFPFLPPFSAVLRACWDLVRRGVILGNLAASLVSLAIGYGLAATLGVATGALMGRYSSVEYLLDTYLTALLASPSLIYVPILFALFGVSRASQVAVVFLYAAFIIASNTLTGIHMVDPVLVEMARSFGATESQLFRKVLLPGALPMIIAGLRMGMARGVKGMINGEMFIALVGLGALLRRYGDRLDSQKVLAILLVVIVVAWIATGAVQALDRRLTRWSAWWEAPKDA
jgi:NitT/TauT family transport system permease protein